MWGCFPDLKIQSHRSHLDCNTRILNNFVLFSHSAAQDVSLSQHQLELVDEEEYRRNGRSSGAQPVRSRDKKAGGKRYGLITKKDGERCVCVRACVHACMCVCVCVCKLGREVVRNVPVTTGPSVYCVRKCIIFYTTQELGIYNERIVLDHRMSTLILKLGSIQEYL